MADCGKRARENTTQAEHITNLSDCKTSEQTEKQQAKQIAKTQDTLADEQPEHISDTKSKKVKSQEKSKRNFLKQDFLRYVIPSLGSMLAYTMYTMVDAYFVARYVGKIGLASVNLAMPFVNSFFALGILFAIGAQAACSYFLGQEEQGEADRIFSLSFKAALVFSPILSLISYIFAPSIAVFLGAEGAYLPLVVRYLQPILIFAPFFIMAYQLEVMAKADGHPNLAVVGELLAAFTNIFLDWLFVGKLALGVGGAAMATGLAQFLTFVIYLSHFVMRPSRLHLRLKVAFDFPSLGKMMSMGLGDFFSEIGIGITIFLYNAFIQRYLNSDLLAIYSVVAYLNLFVESCFLGVSQGVQPLFSYYCGLKDRKRSKCLLRLAAIVVMFISGLAYAICFFQAGSLYAIFLDLTETELAYALPVLRVMALTFFFSGPNNLIAAHTVAHLQSKASMWIHLSRTSIFVLLYLLITSCFSPDAIWLARPLAELSTFLFIAWPVFRQRESYWLELSERTISQEEDKDLLSK